MDTMEVYNQVAEDVLCSSDGCDEYASHWVTDFQKAWPVCEDCRDELTSAPHNWKELRVA